VLRWDQAAEDALAYAATLHKPTVVLQAAPERPPSNPVSPSAEVRRLPEARPVQGLLVALDAIRRESPDAVATVVLPDVAQPFWTQVIFRPDLARLKLALLQRPNVVATSFPGFISNHGRRLPDPDAAHLAFVPVSALNAPAVNALGYARALGAEVVAIHVVTDVEEVARDQLDELPTQFNRWASQLDGERPHLVVIESPYRAVVPPLVSYIVGWRARHPDPICTVVIPELVDRRFTTFWLHNHRAFALKAAMLRQPGIGVADVTFHIGERTGTSRQAERS